ncbi:MAG: glycosyl hydrolase family 18 protein [Deinococcales bacterium]
MRHFRRVGLLRLTVINYAFTNITGSECSFGDSWADYEKPFSETESVDGEKNSAKLKGDFQELKELKAIYPDLKVLMSIGGGKWYGVIFLM